MACMSFSASGSWRRSRRDRISPDCCIGSSCYGEVEIVDDHDDKLDVLGRSMPCIVSVCKWLAVVKTPDEVVEGG